MARIVKPGGSVVMSIKPQFADQILAGTKRVEFRKQPIPSDVGLVVIYSTLPVGRVVGEFTIKEQIRESPDALWDMFRDVAGIDEQNFFAYYQDREFGVAILIDRVEAYQPTLSLRDVGLSSPPWSFGRFPGTPLP